ncbi:MAG: hypothetical protein HY953_02305 [Candidatus Rokubacteria bacterium]|nr:hypothetical protein [Candidatus Rokubacteria bacterium]
MTQDAWTRWIVERFDLGYRTLHALDAPAAQVGPALCLELRRSRRNRQLPDGTTVRRGDPIGILHLNNRRILALHHGSPGQRTVGLLFRRRVVASLEVLAALAADGGPLAHVCAFTATTIFGGLVERIGFDEAAGNRLASARVIGAYQRLLLVALHPAVAARPRLGTLPRARRLWISRERLLALHGPVRARRQRRPVTG